MKTIFALLFMATAAMAAVEPPDYVPDEVLITADIPAAVDVVPVKRTHTEYRQVCSGGVCRLVAVEVADPPAVKAAAPCVAGCPCAASGVACSAGCQCAGTQFSFPTPMASGWQPAAGFAGDGVTVFAARPHPVRDLFKRLFGGRRGL